MNRARRSSGAVDPLFLERWSPRAFDASDLPDADLAIIFEAARWAPSSFNHQPWRFLYAQRADPQWQGFVDLLIDFNQQWAINSSVLLFVLSDTVMTAGGLTQPAPSHSFDAGAAWMSLALQATRLGYKAHAMTGVHFDRARQDLCVPDRFRIEAAIAIGRQASSELLPPSLREREFPSDRKSIEEIFFRGPFQAERGLVGG